MADELLTGRDGNVTRLTLNRPDKANALSTALVEALLAAVDAAHADGTRLLVIDGAGKHFCAGFDFAGCEEASEGDLVLRFIRIETLLQRVHHAPFATLALAHGRVFGAGADLVGVCGRRAAAPGTTFRMPGLQFGLVLGTRRLAACVGTAAARAWLETSATFDAGAALRAGFLTGIAAQEDWPETVAEAAAAAGTLSPAASTQLYAQTRADTREADMATLVASAAAPGLKDRIRRYRAAQLQK
ncbi:MAG: enoyl-CoA hydratase/isomerase family protein [Burkholderiales bacterium]